MKRYKVQKYFNWGQALLESGQVLERSSEQSGNRVQLTIAGTRTSIIVGEKAIENHIEFGHLSEL